jgi:hypothetical protein
MRSSAYWSRYPSVASSNWEELMRGLISVGHAKSLRKRLDRVEKQVREEREAVHILLVLV